MAANDSAKDKEMAAHLRARGIHHGKRLTSPYPNSGGLTMVTNLPGSSKNHRRGKR